MSRDPNRIDPMITMLYRIWSRNPDLRLTQLIVNLVGKPGDPYYVEDDVLEKAMREQIKALGLDPTARWRGI